MSDIKKTSFPRILAREVIDISPWVSLCAKQVQFKNQEESSTFHSLSQNDYVTTFAVREDGFIPVVRQFRPAVEDFTFELPGGLLDRDCLPEIVAVSEIFEETGYEVLGNTHLLGCLIPDSGRLENKLWAYYAKVKATESNLWEKEDGIDLVLFSNQEFKRLICNGQFNHAIHLGVIGLAMTRGLFSWEI